MTDFLWYEEQEDGDRFFGWEARKKFPSGMTGVMRFEHVHSDEERTTYNVDLDIRRKRRKRSGHREVTGQDGLETASWALGVLTEFEGFAADLDKYAVRIEVGAADERRWKLYERVLTKRGYAATMVYDNKTLVKKIGVRYG